jgi:hypothetical protein
MAGHRSYSNHRELAILEEDDVRQSGKGLSTLSKKYGISKNFIPNIVT